MTDESPAAGGGPPGRPLAVFDIDGVLADVRHRLHHLSSRPKAWDAFFFAAADDPVLPDGAALVRELAGDHEIRYLSGRPERTRNLTAQWLADHDLPPGALLLRPDGDHRPARLFKAEAMARLADGHQIAVILDDDPAVVAQLRAAGHPVQLADWLPYADALRHAQDHDGRT